MDTPRSARTRKAWSDRLAGRTAFDRVAAENAIRGAYRASSLAEPHSILWATGPGQAGETIAFLRNPPRTLRRAVLVSCLMGAFAWAVIAQAINNGALATHSVAGVVISGAFLAACSIYLGAWRSLPVPLGLHPNGRTRGIVVACAAVFAVLSIYPFVLQRFTGMDPVLEYASVVAAAFFGALPGLVLHLRGRRAYACLPRFLRELPPQASVAYRMDHARSDAWRARLHPAALGPQPHETLAETYRLVHLADALIPASRPLEHGGVVRGGFAVGQTDFAWAGAAAAHEFGRGGIRRQMSLLYLDGIELTGRAAMVERSGIGDRAGAFIDLAFHVDRLYPYTTVALAVMPAMTVALDAEGRPHAEDGPALAWRDGTRVFAWHGQLVTPDVIEEPVPKSRFQIERERDAFRRGILIERYGLGRYLLESGASEIQHDECGRLYRLPQRWSEPVAAVRVVNSSPEPDGSFREFWLRVPPTMMTAREAVAWTFDMSPAEYDPVAQS